MDHELPEGWVEGILTHIVDSVPTGVRRYGDRKKYFSTGCIADGSQIPEGQYLYKERPGRANREAEVGDVLQAKMKETDKATLIDGSLEGQLFSTGFLQFRPVAHAVDSRYLYYHVKSDLFLVQRDEYATGSTQIALTDANADRLTFPLPPLAEQKRIVAKVEELLAPVDAARERLKKVPKIMKRFRQSVLAAACSGRLTEDWREKNPGVESANKLIDRILSQRRIVMTIDGVSRYSQPLNPDEAQISDIPNGWAGASLDQVSTIVTSGSRGWARYYADSGPIFIRAQNISTDRLVFDDIAHVYPPDNAEGRRTRVQTGDMLVTITGANVTKSALVDSPIGEAYVNQHVALVRFVDDVINRFVHLWVVSPSHGRAKLLADAYGAGKPGLNLDNVRKITLALPPPEEQREIVRRVETLFKLADAIEGRVVVAKSHADKLTRSILAKAFRGELVLTEAELARLEGREYEPASVLLEKIKAERGNKEPKTKGRRSVPGKKPGR